MGLSFEKRTRFWIGLFILAMSVVYVLVTLGKTDWVRWIAVIWGFFLVGLLLFEAGVIEYFRQKKYKNIGPNDILVWITIIVAAILFTNSILLLNIIPLTSVPEALLSFLTTSGVIVGVTAGVLGVFYIFTGKVAA